MRLSLKFIVPLLIAIALLAYGVMPLVDRLTLRWFVRDLEIRSNLITNAVQEPLGALLQNGNPRGVERYFTRLTQDERLFAVAFCPESLGGPIVLPTMPAEIRCDDLQRHVDSGGLLTTADGPLLVSVRPLSSGGVHSGSLVLVHDMSFITRRTAETRKYLFLFFVALGLTMSLLTVVIAQLSWRGWVAGLRGILQDGHLLPADRLTAPEFAPIADDLRSLIRDLEAEHRTRDQEHTVWTADTLRGLLEGELRGQEVIVVSNREPYIHVQERDRIEVRRPASGLVTALEPIMRACSGTWIAHGGGSADREVVDRHDRVGVPPEAPAYRLRRIWLSPEQEQGYYYGFANEGLWPLCHIAHVRPTFRSTDWDQYVEVNRKFARAVADEATSPDPIILVQDYHLALLPRMIREALPGATIIFFWHIPWPNPEAFSICPWRKELLDGLMGSDILGFHTQFHCNNLLDTVDRLLEARVDRELFSVTYRGKTTAVSRYPISVEWPPSPELLEPPADVCRALVFARHGFPVGHRLGVGVDRLDYTKGIEERFLALERLFEMHPRWLGRFTFVQIGAPTRSRIDEYQDYERRVRAMAARINQRFASAAHSPIIVRLEHHQPAAIYEYYRAADVCMVTSLHDGMNLVAKEFVSARDDGRGALILSRFTGAARELPEALVVNPYDTDECAEALRLALEMPPEEQRVRVRLMRGLIEEFNVYRWAGRMLLDAAGTRRRGRLLARASGRFTADRSVPGLSSSTP